MTRISIAACLCASIAFPALAQTIDIDDDGWSVIEETPSTGHALEIGDDGWSYVDPPAAQSSRQSSEPENLHDARTLCRSDGIGSAEPCPAAK